MPPKVARATSLPREPFEHACDAVNLWRGRCLDAFSRAEAAVTETLLVLSEVEDRAAKIELPHLVGDRFKALAAAIGDNGPFAAEGNSVAGTLAAFRSHEQLRVLLCHAVGKITLDAQGRWTLVMRLLALRSRKENRDVELFDESEAAHIATLLARTSQRLCAQLGDLRARIKSA